MNQAVILAAGKGTKIWPYANIRSKCMIPVSNRPIIDYNISILIRNGFDKIHIAGNENIGQIRNYYRNEPKVKVADVGNTNGTAESLNRMKDALNEGNVLILYGDTIIDERDLVSFTDEGKNSSASVLAAQLKETSRNWVGCNISDNKVTGILGHPREGMDYQFAAFILSKEQFGYLDTNSHRFTDTEVGMMSPAESYLEMSLSDMIRDGIEIKAQKCEHDFFDIDKPWHILMANDYINVKECGSLEHNILGEGAEIDKTAKIDGFIKLGKNSKIGHNVIIKGNVIAGDNTIIENGAILLGNNKIGNNTYIANCCYIDSKATVGNDCVVNHCAEHGGIIFNRVYLYHYMEMFGIIGENTDIGAATVCGNLRFDDAESVHNIKGRKEIPADYSNATYLGDYCRTGVNVIIFPGCKIGTYSVIGPGTLLQEDVPDNSLLYPKQELVRKNWGPEKYGW